MHAVSTPSSPLRGQTNIHDGSIPSQKPCRFAFLSAASSCSFVFCRKKRGEKAKARSVNPGFGCKKEMERTGREG